MFDNPQQEVKKMSKKLRPIKMSDEEFELFYKEIYAEFGPKNTAPVTVNPHECVKFPTGIAIALPSEMYGAFIFARSGLSVNHGLAPANCVGVVDSDYRGEIMVALHNHSEKTATVEPKERIAQLAIVPFLKAEFEESDELNDTARGAGGFGSTGK